MSSPSPYDEIYQLLQASKPEPDTEQMERDKRISRVNTFGEALKSLVDVVGGAAGANVQKRAVPTVLSKAVDDYNKNKLLYTQRKDDWDKMGINLKLKELADRMAQQKLDQVQENFNAKLAQEAAKTQQVPIEKEKQRQFLADQWEKNRQARLKAASISANRPRQTSQTTKAPFYTFYDDQTGVSVPMREADVDKVIATIIEDPDFKGAPGTLDDYIKINPPNTPTEKKRMVQLYGNKYKDLIYNMYRNQPHVYAEDNSNIGPMPYEPAAGQAVSHNTTIDIPQNKGTSQYSAAYILNDNLNKVYDDPHMDVNSKKKAMMRLLIKAKYPDGKGVPRSFYNNVKQEVDSYFK